MCHEQAHQKSKLSLTPWKASTKSGTFGKLRRQVLVTMLHKFVPHPGGTFTTEGFSQGCAPGAKSQLGFVEADNADRLAFKLPPVSHLTVLFLELKASHTSFTAPQNMGHKRLLSALPLPQLQWVC